MIIENSSNFREIAIGQISPGMLYRSNHPIYHGKQVKDIVLAAQKAKIKTIINLSDSNVSLKSGILYCPWYKKIFDAGNAIAIHMDMKIDIMDIKVLGKVKKSITFMAEHDPPYLIHCFAGIDRTGFLSVLLESIMGARFSGLVKDYMLSFVEASEYSKSDYRSGSIFMIGLFTKMKGEIFSLHDDTQLLAEKYLIENAGVKEDVLHILKGKLAG